MPGVEPGEPRACIASTRPRALSPGPAGGWEANAVTWALAWAWCSALLGLVGVAVSGEIGAGDSYWTQIGFKKGPS